jgi:hypothetical protein
LFLVLHEVPCPVNQCLKNFLHLPAGTEPQIPAVLYLKHGVLILKGALLLFFQVQHETQAGIVDPTFPELAQSPCSLFFRQGICDLRQLLASARNPATGRETGFPESGAPVESRATWKPFDAGASIRRSRRFCLARMNSTRANSPYQRSGAMPGNTDPWGVAMPRFSEQH